LLAKSLSVGYGSKVVSRDLNFEIKAGQVVVLLGPNGCGKTTLLKTLLGLLKPLSGQVWLDDQDVRAMSVHDRARYMAYVPQSMAMTFGFNVRQTVTMGRVVHRPWWQAPGPVDMQVVDACLERFRLQSLANQAVHLISGGQRQLTLLARALAQEARFVFFDEPTASLDFGNQGRVLTEMQRMAQKGLGVLFTTHDPNHAIRYANYAVLMSDQGLLTQGPVSEVIEAETLSLLYGCEINASASGFDGHPVFLARDEQ
jgi:iron complex transport system ATP-binding protein